jgi:hypothetical protein
VARFARHSAASTELYGLNQLRFREDDGNVGIIRSPVRAIVLPDSGEMANLRENPQGLDSSRRSNLKLTTRFMDSYRQTLDPYRDCPGATRVAGPSTFSPGQFR